MRYRSPNPWKWPLSVGLALLLVWCLFALIPESWLELGKDRLAMGQGRDLCLRPDWMVLAPPIEILKEDRPLPPPREKPKTPEPQPSHDPRWWTEGYRLVTTTAVGQDLLPDPAPRDSVAVFLERLGVGQDLLTLVKPDSVLAARLILLQREDQMGFDELKPYFQAVTRSRAYADILSRAADMYGDFLQQEIIVPD